MKRIATQMLLAFSLCFAFISGAHATNIHFDIINDNGTISSNFSPGVSQVNTTTWDLDLSSYGFSGAVGYVISWKDLTAGLFNRVTVIDSSTLRYQTDVASCGGTGCPSGYDLGVSFFVGTWNGGADSIFASVHEIQVPAPLSIALFGVGLLGLGFGRIRHQLSQK